MEGKKRILIWVFSREFEIGQYNDLYKCPLSLALQREGHTNINVGGTHVRINDDWYSILNFNELMKRSNKYSQALMVNLEKIKVA